MRKRTLILGAASLLLVAGLAACGSGTQAEGSGTTTKGVSPSPAEPKVAVIGETQTIGGLEITVKSVDTNLVVEWDPSDHSQVEGSPFFGVAVYWKNVSTAVLKDFPMCSASTVDGMMGEPVRAEPMYGPQKGNLQDWPDLEAYLRPGTAREGWLTFEQKPGPLTKLYITIGGQTAIWALTK